MKHPDSLEQLYKAALSSSDTPDPALNQSIIQNLEEKTYMNTKTNRILRPLMAVALVALLSVSAFAAWHFLSPADVADQFDAPALAEAFRSEDALLIQESQSQNGYDISLLGIVSGSGLTALDSTVDTAKTYAVVAIEKQNGVMPDVSDDAFDEVPFFVSPLITGQTPWMYNIASMGGGYSTCVVDGVMYRLIECDSVEMFADRGLKLIVSSTNFYSTEAFDYNETTGLVSPKPDFDGVNMIFDLPIDPAKGNFEAAQAYLDTLWDAPDGDETPVDENADPGEEFTFEATADADGNIILTN